MKTLADVKRRAVVGTRLQLIASAWTPADRPPIERTVTKVQTNAIAMTPWPGKTNDSWLWWPKAMDLRIDDDTFTVLENGYAQLTYRFV